MFWAVGVAQILRVKRQWQLQRRVSDGKFFFAQIMFFSHENPKT
jgi:hypothetical protein